MASSNLNILKNGSSDEKIKVLQLLLNSSYIEAEKEILPLIEQSASGEDIAVRFWAKKVLNKYFQKPKISDNPSPQKELSVDVLLQKLSASSESSFVSMEVIKQLCSSKDSKVVNPLITYLNKCKDVIQISFLTKQLGLSFPSDAVLSALIPYLQHSDDRVVANTIEGIGSINSQKSVALITQLLNHQSNRVKANAAAALDKFTPKTAIEVIVKMLQQNNKPHFAISACYAAGQLKHNEFLPYLEALLDSDLIFIDALKALSAYKNDSAVEILESAIAKETDEEKKLLFKKFLTDLKTALRPIEVKEKLPKATVSVDRSEEMRLAGQHLFVNAAKVVTNEIPATYGSAFKLLADDPFLALFELMKVVGSSMALFIGASASLLFVVAVLFLSPFAITANISAAAFFSLGFKLIFAPLSFALTYAFVEKMFVNRELNITRAILAAGVSLIPITIAIILSGLVGLANMELIALFLIYGGLVSLLTVDAILRSVYDLSTYKRIFLIPGIFTFAAYIVKVIMFSGLK